MLSKIKIPKVSDIDLWKNLNELPLVETSRKLVPNTEIISKKSEGFYDRYLSTKIKIPASKSLIYIQEFERRSTILDDYLLYFYQIRSTSLPLENFFKNNINSLDSSVILDSTLKTVHSLYDKLKSYKLFCEELSQFITLIYLDDYIWDNGGYSDVFLDSLSFLIFKFFSCEKIVLFKPGIIDDLNFFLPYLKNSLIYQELQDLRNWILDPNCISILILNICKNQLPYTRIVKIFNLFYDHISNNLINSNFILDDFRNAFIASLIYFLHFYEFFHQKENEELIKNNNLKDRIIGFQNDSVRIFVQSILKVHKTIGLIYEVSLDIMQTLPPEFLGPVSKVTKFVTLPDISFRTLLELAQENLKKFSEFIIFDSTDQTIPLERCQKIVEHLPLTLRTIGTSISAISERIELSRVKSPAKFPNPPPLNIQLYKYEFAMKNIPEALKYLILMLLVTCRSTREFISNNLPILNRCINMYVQNTLYEFINILLPEIIYRNLENVSYIEPLNILRLLLGYYENDEQASFLDAKGKFNSSKEYPKLISSSNISLIELCRIQVQLLINPSSPFNLQKGIFKKKLLKQDQINKLNDFLLKSRYFTSLLQLQNILNIVSDQSKLYFKEHWLDMCKTSFFTVTTSLPVILSSYATDNYQKSELIDAIFYTISIYDDAANSSLRKLKSQMLYNEIKSEAKICLISITKMITDSTFPPIKRFMSFRFITRDMRHLLKKKTNNHLLFENFSIEKLGNLIDQNQLFLLGCLIDTKSMIAERLSELFYREIFEVIEFLKIHGIIASIAFHQLINILKNIHNSFHQYNIPLLPFNDIFRNTIHNDTPNSFFSMILNYINPYFSLDHLCEYILITNPNRLIPKIPITFNNDHVFSGSIGELLRSVLQPTSSFVSVESLRELFWYIPDISISNLHSQLISELPFLCKKMVELYQKNKFQLTRIKDIPLTSTTNRVFDRFVGAYEPFINDIFIQEFFNVCSDIGNIFAFSEMMDDALLQKKHSQSHFGSYFFNENINNSEIFELFDNEFKQSMTYFDSILEIPNEKHILHPFLTKSIKIFYEIIKENFDIFEEYNSDLIDFQQYQGYGAIFSILEFLYCLMESNESDKYYYHKHISKKISLFNKTEGVFIPLGILFNITHQYSIYRPLSIGEKVLSHYETDFAAIISKKSRRFITIYKYFHSILKNSIYLYEGIINHLK